MNNVYAVHLTSDLSDPTDDDLDDLVDFLAEHSGVPARVDGRLELQISVPAEHMVGATAAALEVLADAAKHIHRTDVGATGLEVLTDAELERRLAGPPRAEDLVSTADVAAMLDVTRQRVLTLAKRDDFPQSRQLGNRGLHWSRSAIQLWKAGWDRRPGPKPRAQPADDETSR